MLSIPELVTERLVLRGPTLADYEESVALWSDPIVVRFIGGQPMTREATWGRIHRYVGQWALLGFGYWIARDRESGRYVGEVGLADFRREIHPALPEVPEAGWVLSPWAHGRGLATEAMRAVIAWGDATLPFTTNVCIIQPEHAASIRVAQKLGFSPIEMRTLRGEPRAAFERKVAR